MDPLPARLSDGPTCQAKLNVRPGRPSATLVGRCCPLKARYEKRRRGGGGGAVRRFRPDTKSGEGGGGGCLAEEGAVPYMKGGGRGGLQTPNLPSPPPPPPPRSASVIVHQSDVHTILVNTIYARVRNICRGARTKTRNITNVRYEIIKRYTNFAYPPRHIALSSHVSLLCSKKLIGGVVRNISIITRTT